MTKYNDRQNDKTMGHFINPFTDWGFKKIFGQEVTKDMDILDRMPFMAKNAVFRKLAEIADVNTLTQEEHEKYDSSIKVLRDNIVVYQAAIREGIEKGKTEGRAEGQEEGMQKAAKMMLASGMSLEQVAAILHMDNQKLKEL